MTDDHAADEVDELLRGTVDCVRRETLAARLARGQRLRVKWGIDPSAPDIHLGHTVPMRLLRRWQRCGHRPVIIIGDVTARIGDPSGRSVTRPQLEPQEVEANARTYLDQLSAILDPAGIEVRRQSEWFDAFDLQAVLRLAASVTVAQLLQREDFSTRMRQERPIGLHELFYPLLQGHDSVAVGADVELGGTDQLFNLLLARELQAAAGQPPQVIVTVPLLVGLDGQRKMSKSLGNAIAVTAPAADQYGQLMSLPDPQVGPYLDLLTEVAPERRAALRAGMADGSLNPRDAKAEMARAVVASFHGAGAAAAAAAEFDRVHRSHQPPSRIPEAAVLAGGPQDVRTILVAAGLAPSRGAARDLVAQGGVTLDGVKVTDWRAPVTARSGSILQVGRLRFVRLVPAP
ncbi:MAG TPA: tyrosine--tRNA ligase [Candidatus Micrarchaeia archaeon]|nr:tyrosine--tRNA ligase [Candidatus Micrarchaeia archaeon]